MLEKCLNARNEYTKIKELHHGSKYLICERRPQFMKNAPSKLF